MVDNMDSFDPYQVMHDFYKLDDPTDEEQFRFVEAMELLINDSFFPDDVIAFSYNLAMYYRGIGNYDLEKKYLELSIEKGSDIGKAELGIIWYYGLCGEQDYEKAYRLFTDSHTRVGEYMIADMYHLGQFVEKNDNRCREILENMLDSVVDEVGDDRFALSTLFPEIAIKYVDLNVYEGKVSEVDSDCLYLARDILSNRQAKRPFIRNIESMKRLLELMTEVDDEYLSQDIYDILILDLKDVAISFKYLGEEHLVRVFQHESETVYELSDKWFHGAVDFLENARINGKRITTIYDEILDIVIL